MEKGEWMHGLINRSLENFLKLTYGAGLWQRVLSDLDPGFDTFEPMLRYPDDMALALVDAAAVQLGKPHAALLEDFGNFLIAHPQSWRLRRLMRFGGVDFDDFLHSLDDLQGRARLAVPDLDLPQLELVDNGGGDFILRCGGSWDGFGRVMMGILRAMADEYGALVLLEHEGSDKGHELLSVRVLEARFSRARDFSLAAQTELAQ